MSTPHIRTIAVSGMTCAHCVSSVREELAALPGVQDVTVDLHPDGVSAVTITSSLTLGEPEISEAIAEAGYLVVATHA